MQMGNRYSQFQILQETARNTDLLQQDVLQLYLILLLPFLDAYREDVKV